MDYMIGDFDGIAVYLHEAEWALHNGAIPDGKMVAHRDGNPMNNYISNLFLVDEVLDSQNMDQDRNKEDRIFHESSLNLNLISKHFPDIYKKLASKDLD